MSDQLQLSAELRKDVGKGASRRLRRQADRVPGIVYGGTEDPVNLSLNVNELAKVMENESFYSQVLELQLDSNKEPVIVRDVQRHPAAPRVLHVDFLRVNMNKAIQVSVPLHFINEEACIGVRTEGGQIMHSMNEVEISCLPGDIPEAIEVDMENVALAQVVHLTDLTLPTGVTLVALQLGEAHDLNVASVQQPRGTAEEETVDSEEAPEAEAGGEDDAKESDEG